MRPAAMVLAVAAILLAIEAQGEAYAEAQKRVVGFHSDGSLRYAWFYCQADGRCVRARTLRRAQPNRAGTRVLSFVHREKEEAQCREIRRVVGDQHLTVDGAKKAANEAWAGAVRFHHGEKFMDLSYARNINYTCSRSSIKEGGVTTLGQTLTRCEIEAQPCRAPREGGEK